jgi:tryptophan synthase alpha chain
LAYVASKTTGFLYLVSLAGVTGARQSLSPDLHDFVARARSICRGGKANPDDENSTGTKGSSLPLAVGFGVSTPEMARQVGQIADGVILGSALINAVEKEGNPVQAARAFVTGLREVLVVKSRS